MKFPGLVFILLASFADGADILAVFPHTGKSHFFMFEPYIRELAARGHKITLISHFSVTKPTANLKFISLESVADGLLFNSLSLKDTPLMSAYSKITSLEKLREWGLEACDRGLSHPPVMELIKSKPHFDLVIVEYFNTDCFSILSYIFKAPLMAIFSSVMMPWHYERFGSPDNPSYIVNHLFGFPSEMTLSERVINTIGAFGSKLYYRILFNRACDSIIKKHLGDGLPSVEETVKNTSVFLVNSHFSLFQSRPLTPGIIEVAGMHVKDGKPLPKHLQDYVDKSGKGVIVFTLGSTVLGHTLPEDKRKAIAESFRKLPLNVIWKWENETMPDKPNNVLLQKWVPQNDLLAHKNVKLFVTHSGLMGTEEAVYHGVPMVMMPLFGDQPINAASCQEKGIGLTIDYHSITEETFSRALRTVLQDKRYAERAGYVSRTFKDRPISNMESAVYWTEYVIKYKGAPHLRSAVIRLPWYSEYLLDVFLVIFSVIFGVIYTFIFIVKKCLKIGKKNSEKKLKKN